MNHKSNFAYKLFALLAGLTLLLSAVQPNLASASSDPGQGDGIRRSVHPLTGKLSFLGADPSNPIRLEAAMQGDLSPEMRGNVILETYGREFGLVNPTEELRVLSLHETDGRGTARYQQVYQGIPVMAGELMVNTNEQGALLSINGEVSPELSISIIPSIDSSRAKNTALREIASAYGLASGELTVSEPALWIYDARLMNGKDTTPAHLVWRMEVTSENAPLRELVLVNAQNGKISLHFNQIDTAWTGNPSPAKEDVIEPAPALDTGLNMPLSAPANLYVATTGSDSNDCTSPTIPCATINAALAKAQVSEQEQDTIFVAEGTYTGGGDQVVYVIKSVNLSGGWNPDFSSQTGFSIVDGQHARYGIVINVYQSETAKAIIDHFAIINSTRGFYKSDGEATLKNSAVYYNNVGIYNLREEMTLENVTVSTNSGGGITDVGGISTITNVTISGNTNTGLSRSGTGTTTLRNTIIAGNTADCSGIITSAGNNIVKDTTGCTITTVTGDKFGSEAGLGTFLPSHGYIPLLSTSPAIDAGDACPATDQRGQSRPVDGNNDGTSTCDIGAYEYATPGAAASIWIETGDGQRTRVETAYALPLTVAVLDALGNPVKGVEVTFAAPVGDVPSLTFAGGQSTETLTTDGGGLVTTSIPTANSKFGTFNVTVDSVELPQVAFTLENLNWQWYVSATTGGDTNDCKTPEYPCATINAAIKKANETDTIYVAEGTYTGETGEVTVVKINNSIHILGGWDSSFTAQTGYSVVDGEKKIGGISVYGYQKTVSIDHFMVMNGAKAGGISLSSVTLTISNSAIFNNIRSGMYANGAGVYNYLGNLILNNVTISNNTTKADINGQGGGVYSYMGSATLNNVTITNNSSEDGGGIWLNTANQPGAKIRVHNTILYNNHASKTGPDCYSGPATGNTNNIIGDASDCTMFLAGNQNQLNVNPGLGAFIEGVGYQPLLAGSPAIGAGSNCYDTVDQRGYARGDTCDIGAYEYPSSVENASKLVLAGGDNQRMPPLGTFANPLAVAVLDAAGSPVNGQSITFTSPSLPDPGATFPGGGTTANVTTGADGIVSVVATANSGYGMYTVTAGSNGLTDVSFNLKNVAWFVHPDGDDLNGCAAPTTPCATINGILGKIEAGDTVNVASGVYVYTSGSIYQNYVVLVEKDVTLLGGWNSDFSSRDGYSIIDGENVHSGMYTTGANITIDHFILEKGNSSGFGGGLDNDGTLTLSNSIIRDNSADSWGGGIFNGGTLTLDHVMIYGNHSGSGGGIHNYGDVLTVKQSAIFSNTSDYGGGIYSQTGIVSIYNSTISRNFATQNGGGIDNEYGTTSLNNVTISNNRADYGGGVYNYNSNVNSFRIKNTILALNTARLSGQNCGEEMAFGSVKSLGNSLIANTNGCTYISGSGDKVNVNPLLGTFLPSRGYHPLLTGSPAINAGSACYGTADQRGVARVGACDMGSYEYDPIGAAASMEIVDGDDQRTAPNFTFITPVSVAVLDDNGSPVSGQSVTFTAPDSGPSGTFANGTNTDGPILTNTGGIATSSAFTANSESGSYLVSAMSAGGTSVDFSLANMTLYVRTDGSDTNDCLSTTTPCATIQGAIDKAFPNDFILVAEGEYTSADQQVVEASKNMMLYGGWNNDFTAQSGYSTINGNGVASGVIVPAGVTVSMTRFIVSNSWNNAIQKGGIRNDGTLTLSHCEVSNNNSSYGSGGIYNAGTLSLNDCTVQKNTGKTYGGGIYNSGQMTIGNSIIAGNGSSRLSAGAYSYGGGIYNEGTATISDTLIIENTGFLGGGIYSIGPLVLNRTSVSSNVSANGGGLWVERSANVLDSTIYGNSASGPGGGIYSSGATLVLNNTTISGNTASSGGGIYKSGTGGKITIRNTILGNNGITTGSGPDCSGTIVSGGANIIRTTTGCTVTAISGDQFNVNPQLGVYLPIQGYQPLLSNSPAINAGNSATCIATDQRGKGRVGKCDIGAYEYITPGAPSQISSPTWINYHVPPNSQLTLPLQVAVLDAKGSPVGGVSVTFDAPASGPGGKFVSTGNASATVITAASGIATAPAFIANGELGDYQITATASVGATQFKVTNLVWFVSTSGSNTNDCITPGTPCADTPGAFAKPDFLPNDVVWVATGTYDVAGNSIINIDRSITILGGWDNTFTSATGSSTFKDAIWANQIYSLLDVRLKNIIIEDTGTDAINNAENMVIENSTLRRNSTGIVNGGKLTVINTTISGNDGNYTGGAGGIWNTYSGLPTNTITVINSTIARNQSQGVAGITNEEGAGTITLINSIVIGNINTIGADYDCIGSVISGGSNIIGNMGDPLSSSSCRSKWQPTDQIGTKNRPISIAKVLVSTLTQDAISGQWYHPLNLGSLAIDAGNTAPPGSGGKACPAMDQLGVPRPQGTRCDVGAVEFQFNSNTASPLLVTYTANHGVNLPGALVCSSEDGACSGGDENALAAHQNAYSAYTKYLAWHGRDSIDGNGLQINSTVHYGNNYQNAFWNGTMLVYGDGYAFPLADDIVAHEFTHGVTDYESGLFLWYQSGAISESLSDVWGEAVDQTNGLGNDADSVLWLLGEDVTGLGVKRSMSNPPSYNQPDSILSTRYCKSGVCLDDNGGVHTNSGVNNKAAYLMVNGGAFNGQTVAGLGWTKTLAIYYEAQTNLLTRGSDYLDLYNALYQACMNKVGSDGILLEDCGQVRKATLAVKMNLQPATNFNPDAPYCPSSTVRAIPDLFYEGFETGTTGWTVGKLAGSVAWELSGKTARSGRTSLWANDNFAATDSFATTRSINLPTGSNWYLHFSHTYRFEASASSYYDGGMLEYSTNNGKTWTDAKPLFNLGQNYGGILLSGYGNPLQGRSAFVGDSHGFVDSRYDLSSLAGKTIRFRWRVGTDSATAALGWFVDEVRIYKCVVP